MNGNLYLLQCHLHAESERLQALQRQQNRRNLRSLFVLTLVCLGLIFFQEPKSHSASTLKSSVASYPLQKQTPLQMLLEREIDCIETSNQILEKNRPVGSFVSLQKRKGMPLMPHPTLRAKYLSQSIDYGYLRQHFKVEAMNSKHSGWTHVATLTCPTLCPVGSPHPCIQPQPEVSQPEKLP